jgi:tetraacyldisaccharide 4'-kinase
LPRQAVRLMRLEPPSWWYGTGRADRLKAAALRPAGFLYGMALKARFASTTPYRSSIPVICIGNFTVGGAGKTPLALVVARLAADAGLNPAFLTRGYGGRIAGPHRVDTGRDPASDVGDEALLLARAAPTVVARVRPDGARLIESLGADLLIMDDGFQNPSLEKDLALIAIDAGAGFGNGEVFPAGPLRAPLAFQMPRAGMVVAIGDGSLPGLNGSRPIIRARIVAPGDLDWIRAQPVFAFSGIGRPAKLFDTLRTAGARLAGERSFPDHHNFTEPEAEALLAEARRHDALLVTTEKDWVRIPATRGSLGELKAASRPLPVELQFADDGETQLKERLRPFLRK